LPAICDSRFSSSDPAPSEIYTLSLHDALPILLSLRNPDGGFGNRPGMPSTPMATYYALDALKTLDNFASLDKAPLPKKTAEKKTDRKSTRLNSSHVKISYAVFCLKKKKKNK